MLPDVFTIRLKGSTLVCLHVARRLTVGLRKATEEELKKMELMGVIDKVERPAEWWWPRRATAGCGYAWTLRGSTRA